MNDPHGLLEGLENWNNYWPLLALALEATSGPVLELGMGQGSTEKLHRYCAASGRPLVSYDGSAEWAAKFRDFEAPGHEIHFADNWDRTGIERKRWGVAFVDHAPGERRWQDIFLLRAQAEIVVIHDSEPSSTGYMLDRIWPLFAYRADVITQGAWATAVSNSVDVRAWAGRTVGGYEISAET